MYSCHLFLISSSLRSLVSVLYCTHICVKCPLAYLVFLKRCLVFLILLFSSVSLHCSLKKAFFSLLPVFLEICIQMGISFLFASLLFSAICKAASDNHFAFLHLFLLGLVLVTTSCSMLQASAHSSSGILSDLIPLIYLSLLPYNHKGFVLGHN